MSFTARLAADVASNDPAGGAQASSTAAASRSAHDDGERGQTMTHGFA